MPTDRRCDLCHIRLTPQEQGPECAECTDWEDYFKHLTPAQRRWDEYWMAVYGNEHAHDSDKTG